MPGHISFNTYSRLALLLVCLLSIISYHPTDPGLFHRFSNVAEVHNWIGALGAMFSDISFNLLGYYIYFPLLASLAYVIKYELMTEHAISMDASVSCRVFLLVTSAITPLLALYMPTSSYCPQGPGGMLGAWLGWHMLQGLGHAGVVILCALILLNAYFHTRGMLSLNEGKLHHPASAPASIVKPMVPDEEPKIKRKPRKLLDQLVSGQNSSSTLPAKTPQKMSASSFSQKTPAKKYPVIPEIEVFDQQIPGKGVPLEFLNLPKSNVIAKIDELEYQTLKKLVEENLDDYGISAEVEDIIRGPVITRLELSLAAGTKASRLTSLSRDLARSMSVPSVRVVEVIPGKSCVGLELPNENRHTVYLRELIASSVYEKSKSPLTLVLGKDIAGQSIAVDLIRMPHLLVAGTTGSGKSVGINTMLLSMLYKSTPEELKLILIDPKMLELAVYGDIPHLLTPVVTDMNDAASALRWAVAEMEKRYQIMAAVGVRNIQGYNQKVSELVEKGENWSNLALSEDYAEILENVPLKPFPFIVIVADEFADMIMVVGKKVEQLIARLAQKARASGIHLILATQRPSVDVITGLIKANIPTRIAFQVSSKIDSRTVLDQQGAEGLLGMGDMLYLPPGTGLPVRVHGAFVSDNEVHAVVKHLKTLGRPEYINFSDHEVDTSSEGSSATSAGDKDALLDEAIIFIRQAKKVSISSIQRRFRIGYNRAASLVEAMEARGIVTPPDEQGLRRISMP